MEGRIEYKLDKKKPLGIIGFWIVATPFLGLMAAVSIHRLFTDNSLTQEDLWMSLFFIVMYLGITVCGLFGVSLYFREYTIVTDQEGLEVRTNNKSKSWGKIYWDEIESFNSADISKVGKGVPQHHIFLILKESSPHYNQAFKPFFSQGKYLKFNIYFFKDRQMIMSQMAEKIGATESNILGTNIYLRENHQ